MKMGYGPAVIAALLEEGAIAEEEEDCDCGFDRRVTFGL